MDATTITLFYFTCPNIESAQKICKLLLEDSLIACANIINNLSTFSWNNHIENSSEVTVIAKTLNQYSKEVTTMIQKQHPYQNPCILNYAVNATFSYYQYVEETLSRKAGL